MDDLISRQAAIAEFSCCELTPDGGIDVNYAIDFLMNMPSVQPERKRGKWEVIKSPKGYCNYMSCSVCHTDFIESEEYKWCPNCGARMEG